MKPSSNDMPIDSLSPGLFRLAGSITPPTDQALSFQSLVLLGFARSGKSVLSHRLKKELGFAVFPLDRIRHSAYSRPATRRAYLDLLLRLYSRGLVIEGDNLMGENRSSAELLGPKEFQKTMEFLQQRGFIICLGNSEATVEEKAKAILAYRKENPCWTSKAHYGGNQVRHLATRSIEYSRQLRRVADIQGVPYFELRPDYFECDLTTAIMEIKSILWIEE